jgi:hypothetical protein
MLVALAQVLAPRAGTAWSMPSVLERAWRGPERQEPKCPTEPLAAGNWRSIAAFVAITHMVVSVSTMLTARESPLHLLVVPVYRLIHEPLRAYLPYAALVQALTGRRVGRCTPERPGQ